MDKETKAQFKAFVDLYGLNKDDFQALHKMFIVKRRGIEKIQRGLSARVTYEVVPEFTDVALDKYCIKAIAKTPTGSYVETYGESTRKNCRIEYMIAICEKRALARAILKLSSLYELPVHSEDEISD
jgi:hypothetical protein